MVTDGYRLLRNATQRASWTLALLFTAFSCQSERDDPTGGETHFLVRCETGSNTCGSRLACLCGVCTVPCSERATCESLPAAACVASSSVDSCGNPEAPGHCDVACLIDADCAVLSPRHLCQLGACRADPSPGAPSRDASAGGDSAADGPSACVRGEVSANQVLLIGDSFFAASHQITAYLEGFARDTGSLPSGARYRDNSRLTANALAGGGIAEQYESGIGEAEVKVVIMNGGGADVLLGACDTVDANCPPLAAAATAARELLSKMASDGVVDAVYVFYPDPVKDTTPKLRAKLDALRPLVESACNDAAVRCTFLDLRPTFAGHYPDYIQTDGMNPTAAGSQAAAQAIWAVMQRECIAQ